MSPIIILKISSKFYCSGCDFSYSVCFTFSSLEYPVSVISSQIFIVKKAGRICVLNSSLGISFSCELSACNLAYFPKYRQASLHILTIVTFCGSSLKFRSISATFKQYSVSYLWLANKPLHIFVEI